MTVASVASLVQPEELVARFERIPRIRLAALPTPLEECTNLSAALGGPRIFVKRDDLTGLAFGGNKTRNLEFRLAEALEQGADTIVVALEVISNSARQTVAAANRLGMRSVLVLRGNPTAEARGNLLVNILLGAEIKIVDVPDSDSLQIVAQETVEERRRKGFRPFLLNASPMFAIASALAYTICVIEMRQQLSALGLHADWVYLSSSGKGQAGVVLGGKVLGESYRAVGISARHNPDGGAKTAQIANDTAQLLNLKLAIRPDEVINDDSYVGDGYGVPSPKGIEAIHLAAQTEGLILDPVYTGKALAGLIDHIRQGKVGRDHIVIYIHTGGTPAIFAFSKHLLAWRTGPMERAESNGA